MTLDEAIAEVKAVYADDKLWTMATAEAKSVVFAAVLSGELVPATRAEDASVKLYEGCYGITRGGNGHPPAAHYVSATGNHTWAFKADRHTYRVNGRWSCDKHRLSHHDIIAVYATRAEAEAALAKAEGKTLAELDVKPGEPIVRNSCTIVGPGDWTEGKTYWPQVRFGGVSVKDDDGSFWSTNSLDARGFTLVSRATAPAPDAARDERLWLEGVTEMRFGSDTVAVDHERRLVCVNDWTVIFYPDEARRIGQAMIAAAAALGARQ